jgi:hypothetical protein
MSFSPSGNQLSNLPQSTVKYIVVLSRNTEIEQIDKSAGV